MNSLLVAAAVSGIVSGVAAETRAKSSDNGVLGPQTLGDKHACKGQNTCKGQGGCKTDKHACKGQNACKGQGGCKHARPRA